MTLILSPRQEILEYGKERKRIYFCTLKYRVSCYVFSIKVKKKSHKRKIFSRKLDYEMFSVIKSKGLRDHSIYLSKSTTTDTKDKTIWNKDEDL